MCQLVLCRLQLVLILSLGAGSSRCRPARPVSPVPGASAPSGRFSNFLVLRLEARVSMLYAVQLALAKRASERRFCPIRSVL